MRDLNALSLPQLFAEITADGSLTRLLDAALNEDLGSAGDITTASIIDADQSGVAVLRARQSGVLAGAEAVCSLIRLQPSLQMESLARDGDNIKQGEIIATIRGELRSLLAVERVTLNLLGRLSGIATVTRNYVNAVAGTQASVCDTRKTTPGLRSLEKYAVRCGGGTLHRLGLYDAALYKDNHLAAIAHDDLSARLSLAIEAVRSQHDLRFVEVEVDTLTQLEIVLGIKAGLIDIVLLDNMDLHTLQDAVRMRNELAPHIKFEASGGVKLETVRRIAETGVDRISVGALTHAAAWLDIGMDID